VIGGGIAVAAGAVIGFPTLRLRGVYFALATLAFAFILQIFVMNTFELGPLWIGATPGIHITLVQGGNAPAVFQFAGKVPYYFISLGMLLGILALNVYLNRSRTGYYWAAVRNDPDAAEALGINVAKNRIRAFLLSCFLTGLGGVFYAQYFLTVDPRRILDLGFSIEIALTGIVGGWQSVFGPFLGALVLTPIGELIRARMYTLPGLYLVIYGIILVCFILFLPQGLNYPIMKGLRWLEAKFWRTTAEGDREVRR
jgi:branched-chain amino acid transport system permease protein